MKILLTLLLVMFIWGSNAECLPLDLVWDQVTVDADGNPLDTAKVQYKLYRRIPTGNWKLVATRIGTWFTWYYPIQGHYIYRVTAVNDYGESDPSNELKIHVDTCPVEE